MSNAQDEKYEITWANPEINLEDITREFGEAPLGLDWQQVLTEEEPCRWDNLQQDMRKASSTFPGTLFSVEITKYDSGERFIQYHRDGRHYEAPETRTFPELEKGLPA